MDEWYPKIWCSWKIQFLENTRFTAIEHLWKTFWNDLANFPVEECEITRLYKLFLSSNGHSNGCLPEEAEGTISCETLELVEPTQFCTYCSVLEVWTRLLAISWRKTTNPICKREIPASGKFIKYSKCSLLTISVYFSKEVAARHLYFLKCSRAARKKNLTTACARKNINNARMLANARKDHSIPSFYPKKFVSKVA